MFRKTDIFRICCLFFILGIFFASFLEDFTRDFRFIFFLCYNAFFVFAVLFWCNKIIRLLSLAAFFLVLAFWIYAFGFITIDEKHIAFYNGEKVLLEGSITKEPESSGAWQSFVFEVKKIFSGKSEFSVEGKVLVNALPYPLYNYGDYLRLSCKLKTVENFNDFAYDRFLAKSDIYSLCYYPQIEKIGAKRNSFYKFVLATKKRFIRNINRNLNEPEAGLARAMVLGDKKALKDDLRNDFSRAGLSHIAAISGMHIGIIFGIVCQFFLFSGFWRRQSYLLGISFLLFYVLLIGLPSSALRAFIMGIFAVWALSIGRMKSMSNALLAAAALMLLFNPRLLRDDLGFQLSFAAVFGILSVYPILKSFVRIPDNLFFKYSIEMIMVSLSAQVFTIPIVAGNFLIVSNIALFSNLLVLWLLPFLLGLVIFALALNFVLPAAADIIFLPIELILKYIVFVSQKTAAIPGAYYGVSDEKMFIFLYCITIVILFLSYLFVSIHFSKGYLQEKKK